MRSTTSNINSAPRTSQACENCRVRKSRCLPSEKSGVCSRCLKSGTSCVFTSKITAKNAAGPRVLRKLQPARSDELDVLPSLFNNQETSEADDSFERSHRDMLEQLFPQVLVPPNPLDLDSKSQPRPPVTDARMTRSEAKMCFEKYQSVTMFSPYVQLPPDWNVDDMMRSRPFLSLAIFAAMSDGEAQNNLDHRFKQLLSEKLIIHRQHNLETLQGLLLYFAWCPVYLKPRQSGLFNLVQMIATMVRDLRLDFETPSMDEKRAFLGATYLCSSLAIPPRRPNNLPFSEHSRLALLAVASQPKSDMDKILVSMITIQQIIDDSKACSFLDSSLLQSLLCQVQMMGYLGHAMNGYLELMRKFATMKIYLNALPHLVQNEPSLADQCIAATRDVFEAFIALDNSAYLNLPTTEYSRLVQTIIALFSLFPMLPAGNVELAQFGDCLEALYKRMDDLSRDPYDRFHLTKMAFGVVKEKYVRLVEEGVIINMASMCPVLNMDIPQNQFSPTSVDMYMSNSDFTTEDSRTESSG